MRKQILTTLCSVYHTLWALRPAKVSRWLHPLHVLHLMEIGSSLLAQTQQKYSLMLRLDAMPARVRRMRSNPVARSCATDDNEKTQINYVEPAVLEIALNCPKAFS